MFNGAFYVGEDERRWDVHCEIFSWPDPVLSATCVNTAWIFANCGHMLVSARRLISHLFAFIIDICWNQHDEPIIIIKWRLMFVLLMIYTRIIEEAQFTHNPLKLSAKIVYQHLLIKRFVIVLCFQMYLINLPQYLAQRKTTT